MNKNTLKSLVLLSCSFMIAYWLQITVHELGHFIAGWLVGAEGGKILLHPFLDSKVIFRNVPSVSAQVFIGQMGVIVDLLLAITFALLAWWNKSVLTLPLLLWAALAFIGEGIGMLGNIAALPNSYDDVGQLMLLNISPAPLIPLSILSVVVGLLIMILLMPVSGISPDDSFMKKLAAFLCSLPLYFAVAVFYIQAVAPENVDILDVRLQQLLIGLVFAVLLAAAYKPVDRMVARRIKTKAVAPPIALILGLLVLAFSVAGCQPPMQVTQTPLALPGITEPSTSLPPTATHLPPTPTAYPAVPYDLISQDAIFGYLDDLTAIQPYSGWRNSGSRREAEALDYVAQKLDGFTNLQSNGLELERQRYKVFSSVELWETRLQLTVQGQEIEVPADGLRGSRYIPQLALSLDSDGSANDNQRNPREAKASPLLVQDVETLFALTSKDVDDRIMFLDYAVIDTVVNDNYLTNGEKLMKLINQGLDGLVLVTHYSNRDGESRATFVGDGGVFQSLDHIARIPILYVRLEDLGPAGIVTWEDIERVEEAHLIWDADVFIPGQSGNLVARIPGIDSSRAVILSAHVDSPNGPGVFDDAGGSAILLEVARVMDVSNVRPAVDLYLVWLGGHELGTYGSAYFAATHQDLLDRTLAMMGIDGVGYAFDDRTYAIGASYTPYRQFGQEDAPWPDFLAQAVQPNGVTLRKQTHTGQVADNSNFDAFNVPNFNLDYLDFDNF